MFPNQSFGEVFLHNMHIHGRRKGGHWPPWILKLLAKEFFFSNSRGKKQISPLLAPPGKKIGKNPYSPPWKKSFRRPCAYSSTRPVYTRHGEVQPSAIPCLFYYLEIEA